MTQHTWETVFTVYLLIGIAMMLSRWVLFFQERKKLMRNVLALPDYPFWMLATMFYVSIGSLLIWPYILILIAAGRIRKAFKHE